MDTTISRRGFVKAGALAVGALGVSSAVGMGTAADWLAPAHAAADADERVAYTYHQCHCRGNCTLKCTVRDGRVCSIEPNDAAAEGFRKVCVKGISEVQHIYSAQRIQTPLKRVGERGSGDFVSITWDEAMDILAQNVKAIWDEHGSEAVLFNSVTENAQDVAELPKLLKATVKDKTGLDIGYANGMHEIIGFAGSASQSCVTGSLDIRDLVNTQTFISMGSNFIETGITHCSAFFDAKEAGMYAIAIDPHYTPTASKCDRWESIEPGTDPAFFLGLISVVIEEGWYDEGFLKAHTSFPFLVSSADGSLLRDHAARYDDKGKDLEDDAANPFKAIGSDGRIVNAREAGTDVLLSGTVEVDGVAYRTVFDLACDNARTFDLDWAAKTTGIDRQTLHDIAERYATAGPARIDVGYGGGDRYQNADVAGHAAGMLAALTGNMGKFGTGIGVTYNAGYAFDDLLAAWPLPDDAKAKKYGRPIYDIPYDEDSGIKGLIAWGDMQGRFAALDDALAWIKSLDFVCVADVFSTTTVQYADLVLPICTRFECEEEIGGVKTSRLHVALREKCIDPLFDSKSDFMAQRAVAEALGLGDALPETAEEYVRYRVERSTKPSMEGMTIEELKANQGVLPYRDFDAALAEPKFADHVYPGASGRLDVYYHTLVDYGQALPTWEPPHEQREEHPRYPLRFISVKTRYHIHMQFCDAEWVRQFCETTLEVNPSDMQARGIADGDAVEVFNGRGSFGVRAYANESVRPGSVKIYQAEWSKYTLFGNQQNVTNPAVYERGAALPNGPVLLFNDTLVEIKKAEVA